MNERKPYDRLVTKAPYKLESLPIGLNKSKAYHKAEIKKHIDRAIGALESLISYAEFGQSLVANRAYELAEVDVCGEIVRKYLELYRDELETELYDQECQ